MSIKRILLYSIAIPAALVLCLGACERHTAAETAWFPDHTGHPDHVAHAAAHSPDAEPALDEPGEPQSPPRKFIGGH